MECTIEKVTPYTSSFEGGEEKEKNAVASVTLGLGPVRLMTKLFHSEKDKSFWLQMPGRKLENQDGKWFNYISFTDKRVLDSVRDQAVKMYQTAVN